MAILSMITIAILCRVISIAAFGTWVFFQSTLLLIDTFRSGFLTTAFIKFYAGSSRERSDDVLGSTWFIAIVITLVISLLNFPALFFIHTIKDPGLHLFFQWFGISFWVMLPYFIGTCVVQAEQRFDRLLLLRLINQGVFIICILALIFTKRISLETVLYAYLASFAVPGIFLLINKWVRIHTFQKRTSATIKELYHFGKFSVGTTFSANLFRTSDSFIINFLLGPAALAIYNIGQRLMEIVEIPLRSFAATGMPELAAAYNQDKRQEVIDIMKKYAGMLTMVLIPAGIIAVIFADLAIGIIGGGKYLGTEAANVFRLFMTFALLYPCDRFLALTIDVIHQPKINFIKVLVMLAANIIFDLLGVAVFKNIYGVALATVVPTIIGVAVGYWALNRYMPFKFTSIFSTGYKETLALIENGKKQFRLKYKSTAP